jgi:hypothetical protein
MKCRLCYNKANEKFDAKILDKHNIKYYLCPNCNLLQTEEPYWLEEAYSDSINDTDVGLLDRNIQFAEKVKVLIYYLFKRNGKFLDYAGGYGIFTRLMRDIGFDFYWNDPYTENLFAKGFEYDSHNFNIELITTFESFEHFVNPLEEIKKITEISKNIIFSTTMVPHQIPMPNDWWYYGLEHGQHVSLYSKRTLIFIAKKLGLNFYSGSKNLHLFTEKNINNYFFEILFKKSKYFSKSVNKKMQSKTFADSRMILNSNK